MDIFQLVNEMHGLINISSHVTVEIIFVQLIMKSIDVAHSNKALKCADFALE